jgi:hypothetical protein
VWEFEHTETTPATAAHLWKRYADPGSWPEWDPQTDQVAIEGPFEPGTTGWLKPVGGPKTRFRLLEATEGVSFTDVSSLPLAKMHFTHTITPVADGGVSSPTASRSGARCRRCSAA